MLKVECPSCKQWVQSPYLRELDKMECPSCKAEIPLNDIYISAGPFAIYRDVLLKNIFKYSKLLSEAERELEDIKKAGKGKPYSISADTLQVFIGHLKEMLEGCRAGFRVSDDSMVSVASGKNSAEGKIVNLSSTGACIDMGAAGLPAKGSEVDISFRGGALPGSGFKVSAEVVWAGKGGQIGVKFIWVDPSTKKTLLDFIRAKEETQGE